MVSTNDKVVRTAAKNLLLKDWKGNGGVTGFVAQIDQMRTTSFKHTYTVQEAMREYINGAGPLMYNCEIRKWLHHIGFTDDAKLDKYRGVYGDGVGGLYLVLMMRAGTEIYQEYKSKHKPVVKRR